MGRYNLPEFFESVVFVWVFFMIPLACLCSLWTWAWVLISVLLTIALSPFFFLGLVGMSCCLSADEVIDVYDSVEAALPLVVFSPIYAAMVTVPGPENRRITRAMFESCRNVGQIPRPAPAPTFPALSCTRSFSS